MGKEIQIVENQQIQDKIYSIRGIQVMLDRDLAVLYGVETRTLKQAVRRNISRFPDDFMFELKESEIDSMVSQSVIPSKKHFGGAKPFAFSEQGVAMLSSVLKSSTAIEINIKIMRAFVHFRKTNFETSFVSKRLDNFEKEQTLINANFESRFDEVFKALESKEENLEQGVFYNGQIFDAYVFVADLIKKAEKSIILIDNYIDESVFLLLGKRKEGCKATIYTEKISPQLRQDQVKHNKQYSAIDIKKLENFHDRFLILDKTEIYHFGASLKNLGEKVFGFSKLEDSSFGILEKL